MIFGNVRLSTCPKVAWDLVQTSGYSYAFVKASSRVTDNGDALPFILVSAIVGFASTKICMQQAQAILDSVLFPLQ